MSLKGHKMLLGRLQMLLKGLTFEALKMLLKRLNGLRMPQ